MTLDALAHDLRTAAVRANQRRLLVLSGGREAGLAAATAALKAAGVSDEATTVVTALDDSAIHEATNDGDGEGARFERCPPANADHLLGATRTAVVLDAHGDFSPNTLGRVVGSVDGGGLLVLLTPPLSTWPDRRDAFDERLAVPPFSVDDVTGRFRTRLVETLRTHPGVAVVNVGTDDGDTDEGVGAADSEADRIDYRIERDGVVGGEPPALDRTPWVPSGREFPRAAYEASLTGDQSRTLRALESLSRPGRVVVVEADRGRGKSSAAGLAAGCLAADGCDVLVTAPSYRSANEVFVRAKAMLSAMDCLDAYDETAHRITATTDATTDGVVRFAPPAEAATLPDDPDVVLVDEAAALPVRLLACLSEAPSAGFFTTIHGYEGAGRGFSVRFRDHLRQSERDVTVVEMDEPIRYARGDPVEAWAFRALLLDARPAVAPLVEDATSGTTTYRSISPNELLADEHLLREVFGLLVLAHYRTEPDDLARLLDAPNLTLRALTHDGHVVSVALLAREGGLSETTRRDMYDGGRIRGNMLPDVMTSQLRDEAAGEPVGYRVMRIATHHAVRSRGLGSRLLTAVREEVSEEVDWLGVGYGATPELLSFWADNDYGTVHLSTTRNETSGEYSALMLLPLSATGRALCDRHAEWFTERIGSVLADALCDLEPDVARAALRATPASVAPGLSARQWRVVADAAYGPGLYTADPSGFRRLAVVALVDDAVDLPARAERLLVRKVLQCHPWDDVGEELDFVSTRMCMRTLGDAYKPLVDRYGDEVALEERDRYVEKSSRER
ncbi:MAG: tRNA(Met) cytidine acetyltransferase TmcA [Halobacteriota archaeon]